MDDRGRLVVEVVEGVGHLRQVTHHPLEPQSGQAFGIEDGGEVTPLHPVHDQVAGVVDDEVLPGHGQVGMGRHTEEDPRLGEDGVALGGGLEAPHLQRHLPSVDLVERPQHLTLAAVTDDRERFVTVPDRLSHRARICAAGTRASGGRPRWRCARTPFPGSAGSSRGRRRRRR